MSPLFYQVLHVAGVILLFGFTFSAFADPRPERKKRMSIITGVLGLIVLIAGFGLASKNYGISNPLKFLGWMWAKLAIWLVMAALGGIVFRRPGLAGVFTFVGAVLAVLAVYLVYAKPEIFGR